MNFQDCKGGAIAATMAALFTLAACERHQDVVPTPAGASPSAVLIGTKPAEPSGDPPGTTPVAANTSNLTKDQETTKKPQEGDNHSYSTEASTTPQKSDNVNHASSENGGRK